MVIERNMNEIIIRIPSFVNIDGIQNMIDYLTYKEATAQSEAAEEPRADARAACAGCDGADSERPHCCACGVARRTC